MNRASGPGKASLVLKFHELKCEKQVLDGKYTIQAVVAEAGEKSDTKETLQVAAADTSSVTLTGHELTFTVNTSQKAEKGIVDWRKLTTDLTVRVLSEKDGNIGDFRIEVRKLIDKNCSGGQQHASEWKEKWKTCDRSTKLTLCLSACMKLPLAGMGASKAFFGAINADLNETTQETGDLSFAEYKKKLFTLDTKPESEALSTEQPDESTSETLKQQEKSLKTDEQLPTETLNEAKIQAESTTDEQESTSETLNEEKSPKIQAESTTDENEEKSPKTDEQLPLESASETVNAAKIQTESTTDEQESISETLKQQAPVAEDTAPETLNEEKSLKTDEHESTPETLKQQEKSPKMDTPDAPPVVKDTRPSEDTVAVAESEVPAEEPRRCYTKNMLFPVIYDDEVQVEVFELPSPAPRPRKNPPVPLKDLEEKRKREKFKEKLRVKSIQLAKVSAEHQDVIKYNKRLESKVKRLEGSLQSTTLHLSSQEEKLAVLRSENETYQRNLQQAHDKLERLTRDYDVVQEKNNELRINISRVTAKFEILQDHCNDVEKNLPLAEQRGESLQNQLKNTTNELRLNQKRFENSSKQLAEYQKNSKEKITRLRLEIEALKRNQKQQLVQAEKRWVFQWNEKRRVEKEEWINEANRSNNSRRLNLERKCRDLEHQIVTLTAEIFSLKRKPKQPKLKQPQRSDKTTNEYAIKLGENQKELQRKTAQIQKYQLRVQSLEQKLKKVAVVPPVPVVPEPKRVITKTVVKKEPVEPLRHVETKSALVQTEEECKAPVESQEDFESSYREMSDKYLESQEDNTKLREMHANELSVQAMFYRKQLALYSNIAGLSA